MIIANEGFYEKLLTGQKSPNQIVAADTQEVQKLPVTPFFPRPFSKLRKLDKMGESERIYLTWISNKTRGAVL